MGIDEARLQARMNTAEAVAINAALLPTPVEKAKQPEITIKFEKPPNYKDIVKAFPAVKLRRGVIFTFGLNIYNPDRIVLTRSLRAHETVHSRRQGVEDGPGKWWDQYLTDKVFRLREELLAHQVEYMIEADGAGRQIRRRALAVIAARLSGPIYGRMVSLDEAKRQILGAFNGAV
jgi:hypothetical protein